MDTINIAPETPGGAMSTKLTWRELPGLSLFTVQALIKSASQTTRTLFVEFAKTIKFFPQIQLTEASYHIYFSRWLVINVKAGIFA